MANNTDSNDSGKLVTLSPVKPQMPNKEGLKLGNQLAQMVSPLSNNLYESGSSSQSSRQGSVDGRSRHSSNEGCSTPELKHMLTTMNTG